MTIEELGLKAGPYAGMLLAALGGGGIWKWLTARETVKPAATEQAGMMMENAFAHLRQEIDRQDAALKSLREDGHRLRNALMKLEGAYARLVRFTQDCLATLAEAGIDHPDPPRGMTHEDINELMRGPVAPYRPGPARPVTDKDEGR